ncbi:MAG: BON domain-containing protein [Chloroflexi bacterium]|nr:BON domain-containing protein [Chloroflexota bacterium]
MARYWTNYPYPHYHYYSSYYGPYYGQTKRDDEDIRNDVQDSLVVDSWVNADEIDVEVESGVVTLTGTVGTKTEKRAAGDNAWDTPGVLDVINDIKVTR